MKAKEITHFKDISRLKMNIIPPSIPAINESSQPETYGKKLTKFVNLISVSGFANTFYEFT